jgi:hypothetical protein
MNHDETIALANFHRDELLADAHRVQAAHRIRRPGRPGPRLWRWRPRTDEAA